MGKSATFDVDLIVRVMGDSVAVLEAAAIPHAAIGSMAASAWGDVTWARERADVDFFIRRADVERCLESFASAGFETSMPEESWLVKAHREGVLVDLIFRAAESIELDDVMLERTQVVSIEGCPVRVISPEDFIVMQALTVSRETPDHLFNGASVVAHADLDWAYLLKRSAGRERRVLSLLAHAASDGARVPRRVLDTLCRTAI